MAQFFPSNAPAMANRSAVQRYVDEAINGGHLDCLNELFAPDHVHHCPDGDLYGRDGARLDLAELRTAFPDLRVESIDLVAEGERVARRFVLQGTHLGSFLGIAPSGRAVTMSGMAMHRLRDGRIVESWTVFDVLAVINP